MRRTAAAGTSLKVLAGAGVIRPYSPATLARIATTIKAWGTGPAGGFAALAARAPDRVGLIDELGSLTFGEMHARSNALAHALSERGVDEGDGIAIMCRNHRGFVDATVAARSSEQTCCISTPRSRVRSSSTSSSASSRPSVIHDEEFTELLAAASIERRIVAWTDSDDHDESTVETLEDLVSSYPTSDRSPPDHHSRIVILTSGTTGTPKGAPRNEAGIDAAVSMLSRLPLRYGWRTHIAAPLFHTWGFAHLALGMLLGSTIVLRRKFDPEDCLKAIEDEQCDSLVVIPVMLQRIMAAARRGQRQVRPVVGQVRRRVGIVPGR